MANNRAGLLPPPPAAATPVAPAADNLNGVDPGLLQFMKQNPTLDPSLAKQAYDYKNSSSRSGLFPAPMAVPGQGSPETPQRLLLHPTL